MKVYLLTLGEGTDGDEWSVIGIFSTIARAAAAKKCYESKKYWRGDGTFYCKQANEIEEWELDRLLI